MNLTPFPLEGVAGAFLLAFPALFSIVNPLGGALIFSQVLAGRTASERAKLAGRVGVFSALVLLVSLWAGSYVLNFFGISLAALRVGGGLVVAHRAWMLLNAPEDNEARKSEQAQPARLSDAIAFFPLTMPLTTGPGTISVAIALGSEHPAEGHGLLLFMAGMSGAAILIAAMVWVAYRYAESVVALLGHSGAIVVTRIVAFLLLCIGVQIVINGVEDVATHIVG